MHRHVRAAPGRERVERGRDLGHRLVGAVIGRAEDGDDADRVLVARFRGALGAEVRHLRPDGDEPRLDVEVAAELLPADLDVRAHDEVRAGRRGDRLGCGAGASAT